jgi:hypothetical protein
VGVVEGGGKCENYQLMSQGTSVALIKHKTITYDRPTLYRKGFLGWLDNFRNISNQTTFLTLQITTLERGREKLTESSYLDVHR